MKSTDKYRHYKNKRLYEIICLAECTETKEPVVVYKGEDGRNYVRDLDLFQGEVQYHGQLVKRFEKVSE